MGRFSRELRDDRCSPGETRGPDLRQNRPVRITAKVDYAVRALVVLAAADGPAPLTSAAISGGQEIPSAFLLKILADLRSARLVRAQRGHAGGYLLARPASDISVADVIRAVEGPLADVHGDAPEDLSYPEPTTALRDVWIATRAVLRDVLEQTSVADVASGSLPPAVTTALKRPGALLRR